MKWSKRKLTFEGKNTLINAYIMYSISYLAEMYTEHIPQNFINETKNLMRDFLWRGKTWKVAQKTNKRAWWIRNPRYR